MIFFVSMESHVYRLLKDSCFELYGYEKYGIFLAKKLIERWFLLTTVPESSCFELFEDEKYGIFFSLKADRKMIFTDY